MKVSAVLRNPIVAAALVSICGFAAGAVFYPAAAGSDSPAAAVDYLAGGIAGAVLWLLIWLGSSLALRRKDTTSTTILGRTGMIFAAATAPLVSYFPYLVYRSGSEGEIAELPPLESRWSAILLLVWSLVLLAVLLRMTLGSDASRLMTRLTRRPALTLAVMMGAWVMVFFPLDVLKDHYMHVTTVNSALYREAMLNVFDSRGFMWSDLLFAKGDSIFAVHINVIFIPILPLFRIWPDYRWLILMSDVALALSAWPAYLIARRHFSRGLSLLMAAMLLLHPIMTAQPGRSDFSELRFLPVLFLTACYLFERKRLSWFLVTALAIMTIREDAGIFVAFFGIYALIRRYPLKWILLPLTAGIGWFVVTGALLLPRLAPGNIAARASLRYTNLGSSGSEIAKTLLFRPWKALQAALSTPSHIGAAYGLLISFGLGLPFLSGALVLAITPVAELMFQANTNLVTFMALGSLPPLMFAYINGLARIDRLSHRRWGLPSGRTAAFAGVFFFFLGTSAFHAWFNPGLYQPRYNFEAARQAFAMVPDDARVRLPEFMLVYGKTEQTVKGYHQVLYQEEIEGSFTLSEDDFLIIDRRIPLKTRDTRYYRGLVQATELVESSPDFVEVFARDDIVLFKRKDSA